MTNWENVFAALITEKKFISLTYKELLQTEKKKKSRPIGNR